MENERFAWKSSCGDWIAAWFPERQKYILNYQGKHFKDLFSWKEVSPYIGGTQEQTRIVKGE